MKNLSLEFRRIFRSFAIVMGICAVSGFGSLPVFSESWSGIVPLKSNRADVQRILAQGATSVTEAPEGALRYKVSGGTVTIYFVDSKFVTIKKLTPSIEGTVLEIVLQHDKSSDTPESMGLNGKKEFERESGQENIVYRNLKEGVSYTFVNDRLKTTRYMASTEQLAKARKF